MTQIAELIARWDSNEGKPYKGFLIDRSAYEDDPTDIGCMCAQGQVLYLVGGWSPERLWSVNQAEADKETAALLGISIAHAILLRSVNDKADGAPSIVLTHPEKVLGDQAQTVLAFWRHLDRMTEEDWLKVTAAGTAAWDAALAAARTAAGTAAWDAALAAARTAAGTAAGTAAWAAARTAAGTAAGTAAWDAAGTAAWDAARTAAGTAAGAAQYAGSEIQGARLMRKRGQPFFFLPMFGFADPEAVLAADEVSQ